MGCLFSNLKVAVNKKERDFQRFLSPPPSEKQSLEEGVLIVNRNHLVRLSVCAIKSSPYLSLEEHWKFSLHTIAKIGYDLVCHDFDSRLLG